VPHSTKTQADRPVLPHLSLLGDLWPTWLPWNSSWSSWPSRSFRRLRWGVSWLNRVRRQIVTC